METEKNIIIEVIQNHYLEAVEKSWLNLARNKFNMFGYWAAKESQYNTLATEINKRLGYKAIKTRKTNKSPFFELKETALKGAQEAWVAKVMNNKEDIKAWVGE